MLFWLKQKYYFSIIILIVFADQLSKLWIVYNFKKPIIVINNFIEIKKSATIDIRAVNKLEINFIDKKIFPIACFNCT